jgi:hypothetical protein
MFTMPVVICVFSIFSWFVCVANIADSVYFACRVHFQRLVADCVFY